MRDPLPKGRCFVRVGGIHPRFLTRLDDGRPCWSADYARAVHFATGKEASAVLKQLSGDFCIVPSVD